MTVLTDIRTKVRRLTANPSPNQLSNVDIDKYINTFYLKDLPAHLRLFDLKSVYTFYTSPNIDKYTLPTSPSYTADTPQAYYAVEPPIYVSGHEAYYTQSRAEFFRAYPQIDTEDTQAGNGVVGPYTITLTAAPVVRSQVTISATDGALNRLIAYDDGAGGFTGDVTAGAINYLTGAITGFMFTAAIPATETITVQSVPYVASRPSSVLFYKNVFTLRSVPDKTYRIDIDAYLYPTALLNDNDSPEMQQLWELLGYGASKKVFEDRGDSKSIQEIMPGYKEQLIVAQSNTIAQNRNVRAPTIYTSQIDYRVNSHYNRF